MRPNSSERQRTLLGLGALCCLGWLAYSNSFSAPFVFDGVAAIVENPQVRSLGSSIRETSRPLAYLSFALNYTLHGYEVWGYHVVNWLIHVTAGATLWGIAYRTLLLPDLRQRYGGSALALSWIIAAFWTLHPLQTQSVTYLYQRQESLMGLCFLLSLYGLIRSAESAEKARWWGGLAIVAALAAAATKEVAVALPVVLVWYDRAFLSKSWRELWRARGALHAGLSLTWPMLAWMMFRQKHLYVAAGILDVDTVTPWEYARSQPSIVLLYLRLVFWPSGQCLDYGLPPLTEASQILPGWIVVGGLLLATGWAVVRRPHWGFLGGWFFLILAPTSSIAPINDLVFEHRMYLSLAAVAAAAVLGTQRLLLAWVRPEVQWGAARALTAILVLLLTATTYGRNQVYRTRESVWRDVLHKRPLEHAYRAQLGLAGVLLEQERTEEGRAMLQNVLERVPPKDRPQALFHLALCADQAEEIDQAAEGYRQVIAEAPHYAKAWGNLGRIELVRGNLPEARRCLETALKHEPLLFEARSNLGVWFAQQGELPQAIEQFQLVLQSDPGHAQAYANLGQAHELAGDAMAARKAYLQALSLQPQWPEVQAALSRLDRGAVPSD